MDFFVAAGFAAAFLAGAFAGALRAFGFAVAAVFLAAAFLGFEGVLFFDGLAAGRADFFAGAFAAFLEGADFRPLLLVVAFLVGRAPETRAAAFEPDPLAAAALLLEVPLFFEDAPDLLDLDDGISVSPPVQKNSSR